MRGKRYAKFMGLDGKTYEMQEDIFCKYVDGSGSVLAINVPPDRSVVFETVSGVSTVMERDADDYYRKRRATRKIKPMRSRCGGTRSSWLWKP